MSSKETRVGMIPLLEDVLEFKVLNGIIDVREANCRNCGGNCNPCSQPQPPCRQPTCQQTCRPGKVS